MVSKWSLWMIGMGIDETGGITGEEEVDKLFWIGTPNILEINAVTNIYYIS